MALVRNKSDYEQYVTMPNNLSFQAMSASINYAEAKFAQKVLGTALYMRLNAGLTAADLTPDETALLAEVQKMVGLMAYAHYVGLGNAKVTDQGITAVHTNNEKPAFEWQVRDIKIAALEMAYNAIEDLLLYLESVKANFSDWTSSAAFTEFKELFVPTAAEFTKCWDINGSRLTYLAMVPKLRFVEEFYLDTLLCGTYVAELRAELLNDSLTPANTRIVELLRHFIVRMAVAAGLEGLSVEVSVFGVVRNYASGTVNSSRPTNAEERAAVIANASKEADMYRLKIIDVLYSNIDDYPTFKNGGCWVDPAEDADVGVDRLKNYGRILRT